MRLLIVFGALAGLLVAQSSCSSGSGADCSDGPAYAPGTTFPSGAMEHEDAVCTPRCAYGSGKVGVAFQLAALPSGECNDDGYRCGMTIFNGCGNDAMQCVCKDDRWQCAVVAASGTSCAPTPIDQGNTVRCTTQSGERGPSGAPTTDALPRGACPLGTPECHLPAEVPCACPYVQGPVHDYRCRCDEGQWSCAITSQGLGTCACPPGADGGNDASNASDSGDADQ